MFSRVCTSSSHEHLFVQSNRSQTESKLCGIIINRQVHIGDVRRLSALDVNAV